MAQLELAFHSKSCALQERVVVNTGLSVHADKLPSLICAACCTRDLPLTLLSFLVCFNMIAFKISLSRKTSVFWISFP